ncbi:hypothetical protein FBU30_003849 [Linnemannia zychae]|nr:hypothetical protein FBU30_003849 [Linnemannia zychae]
MSSQQQHEEQTISDPSVKYIEERQEDGSIIRKKITTRTITKRVLTTTTSVQEQEKDQDNTTTITSSESSESASKDLAIGSAAEATVVSSGSTTTTVTSTTGAASTSTMTASSSETSEKEESESTVKSTEVTTDTDDNQARRTFRFGIFGQGDVSEHPFYKFLAKFPLKQSPAPHTRPRFVKPTLYAFAPGWAITGQEKTEKQDNEAEQKETKESLVGSFDVDSLKWMAYLKFNNIDYDIRPAFEPTMSPSGKLPFLALPNGTLITDDGFEQWVQENKPKSTNPSDSLDIHEAAEAVAFSSLAESKIHAALLYTLWFEAPHFQNTTRQHYFGHHNYYLGKLLNYIAKSNIVHTMLLTRTQIDRELIFDEAASAIDALSVQLGNNEYFFGKSHPSSLDAIVFSYLHVILTLPRIRNAEDSGRSGELARMVRKHDNLFKYSQNIWKKYFAA